MTTGKNLTRSASIACGVRSRSTRSRLKSYCNERGLKMGMLIEKIVIEYLERVEKDGNDTERTF